VVSIKRYLVSDSARPEAALRRVISVLLQAVETHSVEGDKVDHEQFQASIRQITATLTEQTAAEELLVIAGAVAGALKDHAERTTRFVRAQSREYQRMLAMLTETVASITQGSEQSVNRLRDIERQLERTTVIEDVRLLRMKLEQCLESMREEIRQQEASAAATVAELQASLERAQANFQAVAVNEAADPVTGLAGRMAAEAALQEAIASRRACYVVVIVANRVQAINARFGYAVGDRVLHKLCHHFRSALSAADRMFRWQGPALLALLERSHSVDDVRKEIARIAAVKIEDAIEIGSRSVLLPISGSYTVFPVSSSLKLLIARIDQFIASQGAGAE